MNFLCKARCWKTFTLLCHVGLTALLYFDQQIEVGSHLIGLDETGALSSFCLELETACSIRWMLETLSFRACAKIYK
jgi:hypothetical protein